MQRVLRLVVTRTVGRTPEELLNDETVKTDLIKELPENCHRILSSPTENRTSIHVLYVLMRLYSNEKPKDGWGKPVKKSYIGIGDDVDRLLRVFSIFKSISSKAEISLQNYRNLLKILMETCLRLEPDDAALQNKYKEFFDKMKVVIDPSLLERWPQLQDNGGYTLIATFAIGCLATFIILK